MAIRDYLNKKSLLSIAYISIAVLLYIGYFVLEKQSLETGFIILASICIYIGVVRLFFLRCSNCKKSISNHKVKNSHRINNCPFCGVSFDEST